MPVPTTGSFKMFDTGDSESIKGAQLAKSPADNVSSVNNFEGLAAEAKPQLMHPSYFTASAASDINRATNFRGYPIEVTDITCFKGVFTEILFPNQRTSTFTLHALDGFSTGSLSYSLAATSSEHVIHSNTGTTLSVSVNTSSNTTFEGWSYNQSTDNIVSTSSTYSHTVGTQDFQIYAIIKSDAIGFRACYYSLSTGETTRCGTCYFEREIFFHRATYLTSSLEDLIWYKTADLSTVADNGYYRIFDFITGSNGQILKRIDNVNYAITSSGDAFPTSSCDGGFIYCS